MVQTSFEIFSRVKNKLPEVTIYILLTLQKINKLPVPVCSQEPEPAPVKKFPEPEPPQNRTAPKPWTEQWREQFWPHSV